ncbi:hypothetical protein HYW42_05370 [Candidatus Daviesbacteria bacterium]|nr:hypothetical protein [Candidatus Daviesbacteria bacterium]
MKSKASILIFIVLFAVVGFVVFQIPFNKLAGSNVSFTLFDFFAPVAGAFLGPILGIVTVLGVEVLNYIIHQTPISAGSIVRLFPMLFAVYYFATFSRDKSQKAILLVPVLAMILFWLHPYGRQAWYYGLFWIIPLIAYFRKDVLLVRSLGATFTAHAVGGAAWIWAFNLPADVWNNLIPIVIAERVLFAVGIAVSYLVVKSILKFLISKKLLPQIKSISPAIK